jgi:hypothetical protein
MLEPPEIKPCLPREKKNLLVSSEESPELNIGIKIFLSLLANVKSTRK